MNRVLRLTLITLIPVVLVAIAGLWWLRKTAEVAVPPGAPPQLSAEQKAARRAAAEEAAALKKAGGVVSWKERHPALGPSDLIVLPMRDETRLRGSWNFELREYPSCLIQALMYLGGKPVRCPEPWPLYAALDRQGISFMAPKALSQEELLELGKTLQTRQIVQIIIDRDQDAGKTIAVATAVDVIRGEQVGVWQAAVETERNTYEALYAAENAIARKVAAALCGLEQEAGLFKKPANEGESGKDNEALEEITFFHYPRFMRAYRLTLEAIEESPHSAEAWSSLAIIAMLLTEQVAWGEDQIWREMMIRSLVAGELAASLDPEDPYARLAKGFSLSEAGRVAEAIQVTESNLSTHPDEPLETVFLDWLWGRCEIPCPTGTPSLWCYLLGVVPPGGGEKGTDSNPYLTTKDVIALEPFAPTRYMSYANEGDLFHLRQCHTLSSIQGSALAMLELVRQLELAGETAAAEEIATELAERLGTVVAFPSSATGTPRADLLEQYLQEWAAQYGIERISFYDLFWGRESFPFQILEMYANARKRTIPDRLKPGSLKCSLHGMALSPVQWVELAERPAIGAAIESVEDIIDRLSDEKSGQAFADALAYLFPEDLSVLYTLELVYYDDVFTPRKVDFYNNAMFNLDPTYNKGNRQNVILASKDMQKFRRQLEQLKPMAPFHWRTLDFIQDQLYVFGDFARAADYAELIGIRYPASYGTKVKAIQLRAEAEDRMLTEEELRKAEEFYPECYADRDVVLAELYSETRQFEKAIALYEKYLAACKPNWSDPYDDLAYLYRLQGESEKALETLERFVEQVPDRLATVATLCDKAELHLYQGDLEGAKREWTRADRFNSGKGDPMELEATLLWLEGKHQESIEASRRMAERYPSDGAFSRLGWAYLAVGDAAKAEQLADEGIRRWRSTNATACYNLKVELLRRRGKQDQAQAILEEYLQEDPHISFGYQLLAQFHHNAGNLSKAVSYAEEFLRESSSLNRRTARASLIKCLIDQGDFERAEREIEKFEAHYPLRAWGWQLRANLEIERGNPQKALEYLVVPENLGYQWAFVLKARAYLDLGKKEEALKAAQWAVNLKSPFMEEAWLTLGKAALAHGDTELAREALERCVHEDSEGDYYGRQAVELLRR